MNDTLNIQKLARSSKKAAIGSLIGVIIVFLAITYGFYMLHNLQRKITQKQTELSDKTKEIYRLENNMNELKFQINQKSNIINELENRIRYTTVFDKNRYQLDWTNSKFLASSLQTWKLAEEIFKLRNQNVLWKLNGISPETGFDSPSFAAYLLIKFKVPSVNMSNRYNLRELLPVTDNPITGDLIFFEAGYTMFYFRDHYKSDHPFCIGMTPLGIVALELNFGPRLLNYAHINYGQ